MQRHSGKIQQRPSLSQVFLKQSWPGQRVIERLRAWGVIRVLEIGPGGGVLTKALVAEGFKVSAVERDSRFAEYLREWSRAENASLDIIEGDVLKFDLEEWLERSKEPTAVVGNIPYHVSSPILLWSLPHLQKLRGMIYLVQLEFAQRVNAAVGTKAYGSLSIYTQLRALATLECKVDRKCFQPVPAVDSALISLTPISNLLPATLLNRVETVTRTCFMQRRKMLRNGIKQWMKGGSEENFPIDLNRRPETLTPEEFVQLASYLYPQDAVS
jgi:16S rRNA (adenine1518-N6/adenine1519-N6)-dimethyltransferase